MSERADLPDVPEAAVEAVARLTYLRYAPFCLPPWDALDMDDQNDVVRLMAYRQFGRSVGELLVEQGWTPPGTHKPDTQANGSLNVTVGWTPPGEDAP